MHAMKTVAKYQLVVSIAVSIMVSTAILFAPSFANAVAVYPTSEPDLVYTLPYPGILPDHPLYPFKRLRDAILLLTARDSVKSIDLKRLFADKHLVMAQLLWEKGNFSLSYNTFMQGERYLLASSIEIEQLKALKQLPPGLSDIVELATRKHIETLTKLIATSSNEQQRRMLNDALAIANQAIAHITIE